MMKEIFAFLFTAEGGKEVVEQIDQADQKTKQLDKDSQSLSDTIMKVVTSAAALTAAWKTFYGLVNLNNQNDQLYLMSEISGVNAQAIAQMGFAMQQFGGDTNTASHALMNLERNILQLRKTGSGPIMQAAMWYGIGISADPEKMMKNIARRMESLPRAMKFDLGHMLGLDNATIMLLSKGVKAYEQELERAKKYTFVDQEKVEQAHELKKTVSEMSAVIGGIGIDMLSVITPSVQAFVEFLRDGLAYLREHQEFLGIIASLVGGIGAAFGSWKVIGLILSPLGAIVAGIIAAALAAEDLYMYFTGNNSAIGELLEKFPELKPYVDEFGQAVKDSWKYFAEGQFVEDFKTSWNSLVEWWQGFSWEEFWNDPLEGLMALLDTIAGIFDDLGVTDALEDAFEDFRKTIMPIWDSFIEKIKAVQTSVANLKSELATQFKAIVDGLVDSFVKFGEVLKNLSIDEIWEKIKQVGQWFSDISSGIFSGITNLFTNEEKQITVANPVPANDALPIAQMQAVNAETRAMGQAASVMTTYNTVNNNSATSNPVNANVEVHIYPNSMDTANSEDIGLDVGRGIQGGLMPQFARGVR